MENLKKEIIDCLKGKGSGIPKERLDWEGIGGLLQKYDNANDKGEFESVLAEIIGSKKDKNTDWDWGLIADLIYFCSAMNIGKNEVKKVIFEIPIFKVPSKWRKIIEEEKSRYFAQFFLELKTGDRI